MVQSRTAARRYFHPAAPPPPTFTRRGRDSSPSPAPLALLIPFCYFGRFVSAAFSTDHVFAAVTLDLPLAAVKRRHLVFPSFLPSFLLSFFPFGFVCCFEIVVVLILSVVLCVCVCLSLCLKFLFFGYLVRKDASETGGAGPTSFSSSANIHTDLT